MGGHDGFGFGFGLGGGFMWIIWILLIVLVVWLVKGVFGGGTGGHNNGGNVQPSALEILKQRYARGEIDHQQYERMRKDLLD